MPEVVEAHLWQPRLLEQRLEGPLHKVLRLNRRPGGGGEDKALIFVETGESHSVLELALAVSLESVHRPGREVHPPPAAFSLRLSKSVEASLSHQGAAHPERALLQDCVILTKAQDLPAPQPSGDRQHVEGLEGKAVIIRTDPYGYEACKECLWALSQRKEQDSRAPCPTFKESIRSSSRATRSRCSPARRRWKPPSLWLNTGRPMMLVGCGRLSAPSRVVSIDRSGTPYRGSGQFYSLTHL